MQGELEATACLSQAQLGAAETISKRNDIALKFRADSQTELNERQGKLSQLSEGRSASGDRVDRTSVIAPSRAPSRNSRSIPWEGGPARHGSDGNCSAGRYPAGRGQKVSPKDIAFLRPGLEAVVKITAL